MEKLKQMRHAIVLAALGMGQSASMAQVVVTYGPDVTSVPTLSEWGLILMSVLLAVVAVIAVRKGASSKTVVAIALAAMGSFGSISGTQWGRAAWANGFTTYPMTAPTGGVLSIPFGGGGFAYVRNDTAAPLKILSVTPQEAQQTDGNLPACTPGLTVAPNTFCWVKTGIT